VSIPSSVNVVATLRPRLLKLAGYPEPGDHSNESLAINTRIHSEFKLVLSILEEIAARKVNGYGPFRYDEIENNWRWEIQSLYQDIERKFGRLKTLCRPSPVAPDQANQILEILADLSVYSARGIQIIARLEGLMTESTGLSTGEYI